MPIRSSVNRRDFLKASAIAGTGALAAPAILKAANANERINLAFIGVGGRGGANLRTMTNQKEVGVNVVALCDVNGQNLATAKKRHPDARTYTDFRKLFEKTDDIDAVVVSTTEHTHAYATMPALQLGKPVYCEKPLSYNIDEARKITIAAAKANVPTQMGTQIHGKPNYRRVAELIWSGAIGPVKECHVWVGRAWGRQSAEDAKKHRDIVSVRERPSEEMTPPAHLDWDQWLGPAPARPYHNVYFPGPKWYRWWDFGNGTMSDLGSHWNDLPFWALKLDAPLTVEAFGPEPHAEIAPASMSAKYEYAARSGWGPLAGSASIPADAALAAKYGELEMPACELWWHQGANKPDIWKNGGIPQWGNGVLFIGEKGMLLADYSKHLLLPLDEYNDYKRPDDFLGYSPGQHEEWLLACKNGTPTSSPFSYAGPLTEANHLGNVAFRAGLKIEWDAENAIVKNCPHANGFVGREPRAGWSLE